MCPKKILLIDDDDDIREVASLALEMDGEYEVTAVSSGRAGIASAASEQPHVILLDYMMPEMDGPTTLAQLRLHEETSRIPVVFLTAKVQASEQQKLLATGAAGLIPKPFDAMNLATQLTKLLAGRKQ
jgi:CheY-like chemotaxis protein